MVRWGSPTGRGKFVYGSGESDNTIGLTYRKNVALQYGCSVLTAELLDLSAADKGILCHKGWRRALPK